MNKLTNNLAINKNNTFAASKSPHLQHKDISNALQNILDFNELIQIFSTKIQKFVPHNGLIYTNHKFNIKIQNGSLSSNSCSYTLNAEDKPLGELQLLRKYHFDKTDIYLLETLLCYLISSLRNATLFNQALTMAYTDLPTQTNNRPSFNESIKREITISRRYSTPLTLIFIDIDNFEGINEAYGKVCGDRVLAAIANCIKESIRTCDITYRYSGEEFAILLGNTNIKWAKLLCERIRSNIENIKFNDINKQIKLTASFGACCLNDTDTVKTFIYRADGAVYQAKINGRNQVVAR